MDNSDFLTYVGNLPLGSHLLLIEQPEKDGLVFPVISEGGLTMWMGDKRVTVVVVRSKALTMPREGPSAEAFKPYAEQLNADAAEWAEWRRQENENHFGPGPNKFEPRNGD